MAYLLLLASGSLKSSSSGRNISDQNVLAMVIDNKPEGRKDTGNGLREDSGLVVKLE